MATTLICPSTLDHKHLVATTPVPGPHHTHKEPFSFSPPVSTQCFVSIPLSSTLPSLLGIFLYRSAYPLHHSHTQTPLLRSIRIRPPYEKFLKQTLLLTTPNIIMCYHSYWEYLCGCLRHSTRQDCDGCCCNLRGCRRGTENKIEGRLSRTCDQCVAERRAQGRRRRREL